MKKFMTREAWLTDYALACGYIEKIEDPKACVVLSRENARFYTVTMLIGNDTRVFEFTALPKAREAFKAFVKCFHPATRNLHRATREAELARLIEKGLN